MALQRPSRFLTFLTFFGLLILLLPTGPARAAGPHTFVVTTTDDSLQTGFDCPDATGSCTLRQALTASNNSDPGTGNHNTITFANGVTGTIVLKGYRADGALYPINAVTIMGPGASVLAVDGGCTGCEPGGTPSGGWTVFYIAAGGGAVTISGLTIRHGNGSASGNPAGGIYNGGTLTLDRMVLRANNAGQGGGAISNGQPGTITVTNSVIADNRAGSFGGGIVNAGTMAVENTTLSGNRTGSSGGGVNSGAIQNAGRMATLTMTNCTIAGNSTDGDGGGISNLSTLAMTNCTLANNSANGKGGGIYNNGGTVSLTDTIVAGNTTGGDTSGTGITSDHSLIGATPTMLPLAGSPAIDAGGTAANGCPAADQRGIARPQGAACDIGAVEVVPADTTPPTTTATLAGTAGSNGWYRSAVQVTLAATDPDGAADVASTTYTVDGGAAQPYTAPFTVAGDGTHTVTFSSRDKAGNAEATQTQAIKIDATAPTAVVGTPDRGPDSNGWYNHAVMVTFSGSDATSGIASCTTATYSGPDSATASVSGTCTDNAGNSASGTFALKYDATPPVTTATPSGKKRKDGVYTSDVKITLSASDGITGSGVAKTEYKLDNGGWKTYTGPITIRTDDGHTLLSRSTDRAGNVEATKRLTLEVQHEGQGGGDGGNGNQDGQGDQGSQG